MFETTKKLLDEFERIGIPGFDLSVWQNGKEVFREMRGVSDEKGTAMTGKEKYNIYSCSKVFTCVAAMMLIEEGKMRLDDELALYLPAFADMKVKQAGAIVKAEKRITLFHLFTMTAGLNYSLREEPILRGKAETEGKAPTVEMMKYLAEVPLDFEPGTTWQYSLCHDVLAAVVEVVSGKRFGEFVKERILDPLGLKNTTFLLPEEEVPTLMDQYAYKDVEGIYKNIGKNIWAYKLGSLYESGGAGGISTVDDYIRFLEGIRTGKLLNEKSIALMSKDHLRDDQRATCWVSNGYGYGLGVRTPKAGFSKRTDFGWGGAAGAFLAIDKEKGISLYYAQHVLNSVKNLRKDLIEAVKLDLGYPAFEEDMWTNGANSLA